MRYGAMSESAAESLFQVIAGRAERAAVIITTKRSLKRMQHWNRASGRYLHPTPPQTIACSAFYEVAISATPQHFQFQPPLRPFPPNHRGCRTIIDVPGSETIRGIEVSQIATETRRGTADDRQPQELHLRNRKSCPNKRGHLCHSFDSSRSHTRE
jgi:hypothetical protein